MMSSLLCTAAFASVNRSSAYLSVYRAVATAESGGKIAITVDVSGRGAQDEIGAKTIYIFESSDGSMFSKVATYKSSDYPEMLGSGTFYYDTPVKYKGTVGKYYKASVYIYAGKDGSGDQRLYTTGTVKAIA